MKRFPYGPPLLSKGSGWSYLGLQKCFYHSCDRLIRFPHYEFEKTLENSANLGLEDTAVRQRTISSHWRKQEWSEACVGAPIWRVRHTRGAQSAAAPPVTSQLWSVVDTRLLFPSRCTCLCFIRDDYGTGLLLCTWPLCNTHTFIDHSLPYDRKTGLRFKHTTADWLRPISYYIQNRVISTTQTRSSSSRSGEREWRQTSPSPAGQTSEGKSFKGREVQSASDKVK